MDPKLQMPSPSHTGGLGASGNWHGGWTQSLVPNRHWSSLFILTSFQGPLQPSEVAIKGVSAVSCSPKITPPLLCSFGKTTLTHSFLLAPRCPVALTGCDLLVKLQISINLPFLDPISILCIQMAPKPTPHSQNLPSDLPPIEPRVWDSEAPLVA